ncbi:MAG: 2-oxoacid:acceptor oxidoreductase family protein [Deltaproteobacteria bacterium]|nr:2-oxoacid:acceptor oxidoreductase family protein [Deltaproteobacteria bacterium]
MTTDRYGTKENRRYELVMAGLGGQGVLLATQILMRAGMGEYPHVSWFPSYATLVRGGDCEGTAILSDEPIHSPLIFSPDSMIIMSMYALETFVDRIAPGSLLILDSSLISQPPDRDDVALVQVPATQKAADLGSSQAANLLLLGVYLRKTGALGIDAIEAELTRTMVQENKETTLPVNLAALKWGFQNFE